MKILFYDIETRPNLAYVWGKYEQNVIEYKEEWQILSVAYKWQGERTVKCITAQGKESDLSVVKELHKLFNAADIVVAHNGDQFDQKKVRARMVYHNLKPVKPLTSIDTRKVAKLHFNFNGNSLNDLGGHLNLGKKVKTGGFELWLGCMAGEEAAWRKMIKYNKMDVTLLEKVYNRFRPWMVAHPNMARLVHGKEGCPKCASLSVLKQGVRANSRNLQQQWQCKKCHGWYLTALKKVA